MEDDEFLIIDDKELEEFKYDMQRCIANNDKHFISHRKTMLFEEETKIFLRIFDAFENLEIRPGTVNKSFMQFNGTIADDIIQAISDEDMRKIKQNVFLTDSFNLAMQMIESKKTEQQKNNERIRAEMEFQEYIEELKEVEQEYREAKLSEKNLMKFIQNLLKEHCNLPLDYEECEGMLMLSANFDCVRLTRKQLALLKSCVEKVDALIITPVYADDENTCEAIRIVLSLDLSKGE